jgi:cobalt-zinc-cadmium efflux system protein
VGLAALLTGVFMLAEVAGGLISGSLALLADAGHMFTDFVALAMAWGAFRLATRPANDRYTYGYDRISILVAFVNGLTLFAVAVWIVWEAVQRLSNPADILAGTMLWIAVGGLAVNLIVFWVLLGADQENLNIRGAVIHVIGDLLGSVGAIAAALIIMATGWGLADPILSVLVAILIMRSAWRLIKDSAHVLMQGTPKGLDNETIGVDLIDNIEGLVRVENIRVWSLTQERPVMTLTAHVNGSAEMTAISKAIEFRLAQKFQIDEVTIAFKS